MILISSCFAGRPRRGKIVFEPPCYFQLYTSSPQQSDQWRFGLLVLCVPVSPGVSRVFVAPSPGRKIPKLIPKWFLDSFTNRFLDTDLWIHDQERFVHLPTNSFQPEKASR